MIRNRMFLFERIATSSAVISWTNLFYQDQNQYGSYYLKHFSVNFCMPQTYKKFNTVGDCFLCRIIPLMLKTEWHFCMKDFF